MVPELPEVVVAVVVALLPPAFADFVPVIVAPDAVLLDAADPDIIDIVMVD